MALHDPAFADEHEHGAVPELGFADDFGGSASFSWTGLKWPQPGLCGSNCPGTPLTITYSYQNMFDGSLRMPNGKPLPNGLIRKSIEEALGLWANYAPLNFVEVEDDGLTYSQGSTKHGQIRFRHVHINGPDPAVGNPIAKAQAYFPGSSNPLAGDVEFDRSDRWQKVGTLAQPDILGATIHEVGHSLGLNHSTLENPNEFWTWKVYDQSGNIVDHFTPKGATNMFWIFPRFAGPGTGVLYPDDIAGIRFIYGTGQGSVYPLARTIPEPSTIALLLLGVLHCRLHRRR